MFKSILALAAVLSFVVACDRRHDDPPSNSTAASVAGPASAASAVPSDEAPADDPALHRSYGPPDVKLVDCAKLSDDGVIEGHDCPDGIVIFGPYARVPRNVDLKVGFDITPESDMFFATDVVSKGGQAFHFVVDEEPVLAKRSRHVGYKVHLSEGTEGLESRIWVRSASGKSSFKVANVSLVIP